MRAEISVVLSAGPHLHACDLETGRAGLYSWVEPGEAAMRENTAERWGSVQIGLHWTIAALVLLVQVPAGIGASP